MVPVSNIIACCVTLFISFLLPLLGGILLSLRHRKEGLLLPWLLGALGFFVPQMAVRTPLLQLLSPGLADLSQAHPLVYGLGLAFTAALFELSGRLMVARLLKNKLTFRRGLAAGMGHGGIESILIVGLAYITNLYCISLIQSGEFDALLPLLSQVEGAAEQMEAMRQALITTPWWMFLLAGLERLLTMVCHAGLSLLVCYCLHQGNVLTGSLLCLAAHTVLDSAASVTLFVGRGLNQAGAYVIIYCVLTLMAALSIGTIITIHRRWPVEDPKEVLPHESL